MKLLAEREKVRRLDEMYNKINKKLQSFLAFVLSLVLLFVFLLGYEEVYAQALSDTIVIEQKISINSPYAKPQDSFAYVLESQNQDGSLEKNFKIKGDGKKYLNINYEKAGEYTYKLYQEKTDIESVSPDTEVYYIYVKIIEANGKLQKDYMMIKNSSGKKVSDLVFNNRYKIDDKKTEAGQVKPKQKTSPQTSKNVKTGVESYIIPCLLLILALTSILLLLDKNTGNNN